MLKAFRVSSDHAEVSVIVFAATVGRAKSMALRELEFDGFEFTELKARREKKADAFATREQALTMYTPVEQKIYQSIGWHEFEANYCDGCGEYEFSLLPETKLNEYDLCATCMRMETEGEAESAKAQRIEVSG